MEYGLFPRARSLCSKLALEIIKVFGILCMAFYFIHTTEHQAFTEQRKRGTMGSNMGLLADLAPCSQNRNEGLASW